ncbi:MAG: glycosyltransferase [Planctomycetales bacterium]|nr:glycosyltransferase [Planctomycetales bacterium]
MPTVLVHHLTGYWQLLSGPLHRTKTRLLLFFPNTPIRYDRGTGGPVLEGGMQSKLFRLLIKRLAKYVAAGKAVLGVETEAMQRALTNITGVPFQYLPHPVAAPELHAHPSGRGRPLVFGAYGAARFEKGSDILQAAIERHFTDFPQSDSQFRLQWIDDFRDEQGILIGRSKRLQADPRVEYITHYFAEGEYAQRLAATDVMVLPYREPYRYRVSRVAIEALQCGMPTIVTSDTTLAEQAAGFGAGRECSGGDAPSLATAIRSVEQDYCALANASRSRAPAAREHFSVPAFVSLLTANAK